MMKKAGLLQYNRDRSSGFTLVELIFVIIIISMLTMMAVLVWPDKRIDLNTQSQQLINTIRYIRHYAMTHDSCYRINFNSGRRQVSFRDCSGRCVNDMAIGGCRVTLASGIRMATLGLPNGYVAFDRYGTPYLSEKQRLRRSATIMLTAEGKTRMIRVIAETGALTLS